MKQIKKIAILVVGLSISMASLAKQGYVTTQPEQFTNKECVICDTYGCTIMRNCPQ